MKSAYELAMERLDKAAPTVKLTADQKTRIAEINSLYGAKIAEKETFLQGEIAKEKARGDMAARCGGCTRHGRKRSPRCTRRRRDGDGGKARAACGHA
jgi:hypothetical protein